MLQMLYPDIDIFKNIKNTFIKLSFAWWPPLEKIEAKTKQEDKSNVFIENMEELMRKCREQWNAGVKNKSAILQKHAKNLFSYINSQSDDNFYIGITVYPPFHKHKNEKRYHITQYPSKKIDIQKKQHTNWKYSIIYFLETKTRYIVPIVSNIGVIPAK